MPKFHDGRPTGPLAPVRDPKQYANQPIVQRVYEFAAETREVLYQLPCYCECDKDEGHTCLLDCFTTKHGVDCKICQQEVVLAFRKTKQGLSPSQIRSELARGLWNKENVDDLNGLPMPKHGKSELTLAS